MGYRPESRLKKDHLGLEPGRQSPPLWGMGDHTVYLGVRCLEQKSQKIGRPVSNFNSMLSPCTGSFGVISERLSSNLSFWDAVRAKL